jgi:hypothetical protein
MSMQLKERIIVADPDGHFEMWTRQEYDNYIKETLDVGACPAYGIVTHFNEDERLLAPTPPASAQSEAEALYPYPEHALTDERHYFDKQRLAYLAADSRYQSELEQLRGERDKMRKALETIRHTKWFTEIDGFIRNLVTEALK